MKSIVYGFEGRLRLCNPCVSLDDPHNFDESSALARAFSKDIPPEATNVRIIDRSEIPRDRTFRNAWEDTGTITVNMPLAREIWRDKMRQARAPKLEALDVEYMQADEVGDASKKAIVAQKKKALRDVTSDPAIEAAQTPEELKLFWPSILS